MLSLVVSYQYFHNIQVKYLQVTSFKECADAGFNVLTTYPEKCIMPGKSFINPLQKKPDDSKSTLSSLTSYNYKNEVYLIEGRSIQFLDGKGILPPNPILKQSTTSLIIIEKIFLYDINDDAIKDTVFLIRTDHTKFQTKNSFYLSSSISLNTGFSGTNGIFLDHSISNATFVYKNGEIVVDYITDGASTTVKQKYFLLENDILKQVSHK